MTLRISEGVKGLLRTSNESLVVCALRRVAAVWRTSRGSGGSKGSVVGLTGPGMDNVAMNWRNKLSVEEAVSVRAAVALRESTAGDMMNLLRPWKMIDGCGRCPERRCSKCEAVKTLH